MALGSMLTGNAGKLVLNIGADGKELTRKLATADAETAAFSKRQAALGMSTGKTVGIAMAVGLGVAGVALGGLSLAAVKMAASYEQSLTNAISVTGKFGAEYKRAFEEADKTAVKFAQDTKFTAREIATAMYDLASKGFAPEQFKAALEGITALAAATQSDLTQSTETVTSTIRQFGLELTDSAKVSDVLTKSISSSAATMDKLGTSLGYVGPVASALGFSLEETVSVLDELYNAGFAGQKAGTQLRFMLLAIQNPTSDATALLDKFGISSQQLARERIPGMIKRLVESGATAGEVAKIFRVQTAPAVLALMSQFKKMPGAIDAGTRSLEQAGGFAKKVAAIQLDTVQGQMTLLHSSLETLIEEWGKMFLPGVQGFVTSLVGPVNELSAALAELDPATKQAVVGFTLVSTAGGVLLIATAALLPVLGRMNLLLHATLAAGRNAALGLSTAMKGASAAALGTAFLFPLALEASVQAGKEHPQNTAAGWRAQREAWMDDMRGAEAKTKHAHATALLMNETFLLAGAEQKLAIDEAKANEEAEAGEIIRAEQERHVKSMTDALGAMVDPQKAFADATATATEKANAHAEALGLDAKATQKYVDSAKASLKDFMDTLEAQFAAQDKLIWNEREIIKRLIASGMSPEAIQALMEDVADLPAQVVDQYAKSSETEFARMTPLMEKLGERSAQGWDDGVTADMDARTTAAATYWTESWAKAVIKRLPPGAVEAGKAYSDAFKTTINTQLANWLPTFGGGAKFGALGAKAAGDIDPAILAQLFGLNQLPYAPGKSGSLASTTAGVWNSVRGRFPGASWMGGYATSGHIRNSDHYTGHAFDVGGPWSTMQGIASLLAQSFGSMPLKYIIFNRQIDTGSGWRPYHGANPHTDHVHVSTYHGGGQVGYQLGAASAGEEVISVLQVGERVLTANQNNFLTAVAADLKGLIDVLRAAVNADKDVPVGGKGAAANEQILSLFSSRSSEAESYISRESARLNMLQAIGADLQTQMDVLERQSDFIDKAIAEKTAQLQVAKDRKMNPEDINQIATELFGLQAAAADARRELEYLANTPLENAIDQWSAAISGLERTMSLMSDSSMSYELQLSMFPQLMGALGAEYENLNQLMQNATNPADIISLSGQVQDSIMSMYNAEKSQLDRALSDSMDSISESEEAWMSSWETADRNLRASIDRQQQAIQAKYDSQISAEQKKISALLDLHRTELRNLQSLYDGKLKALEDSNRAITREQTRNEAVKHLGKTEDELRILQGQGFYTEADIARMRELETQAQDQRDAMAQQDDAWAREDARTALERERDAAIASLQLQQEAEQNSLQAQVDAQIARLQSQQQAEIDALNSQLEAHQRQREEQQRFFEEQRQAAQDAYQAQIDLLVGAYTQMLAESQKEVSDLLNQSGQYQNAGYTLGLSFAAGIIAAIPSIQAAAQAAADAAAQYLELHSPAKKGPLSRLPDWWVPFGNTLLSGMGAVDWNKALISMLPPSMQTQQNRISRAEDHIYLHGDPGSDPRTLDILADRISERLHQRVYVASQDYGS